MNKKILKQEFKNHLLKTVGRKPTKKEMIEIERKIKVSYGKIYDKPNKEELVMKKIYDNELSKVWGKVVANEDKARNRPHPRSSGWPPTTRVTLRGSASNARPRGP